MYKQINTELEKLQEGIYCWRKAGTMLNSLYEQKRRQEDKMRRLEEELRKENLDVDKLSKMSLTSIFYTVLGSREKQMEKERQEALAAELKYKDILWQLEDTDYQISKLRAERAEYSHCEKDYHELFQKKYQMLKQNDSANARRIAELEDSISVNKANLKEISEAISAGNSVISSLDRASQSLNSAENWGVWDMWGGGGLITNMVKHGHIDDAKDAASEVQMLLNRFRAELADIQITSQISINIDGFTKFADFFFDGLITDWVVQSKIHDSQRSVNEVRSQVRAVLSKLHQMEDETSREVQSLEGELRSIVSGA